MLHLGKKVGLEEPFLRLSGSKIDQEGVLSSPKRIDLRLGEDLHLCEALFA